MRVRLGERLKDMKFAKVFTSPLQRAARTCELSGFGAGAITDPDLVEWDYGKYEGTDFGRNSPSEPKTGICFATAPREENRRNRSASGPTASSNVSVAIAGDVLIFSSGHFIRVLTARWLGLAPGIGGRYFLLSPASLSALSYEHNLSRPVIRLWNDDHHVISEPANSSGEQLSATVGNDRSQINQTRRIPNEHQECGAPRLRESRSDDDQHQPVLPNFFTNTGAARFRLSERKTHFTNGIWSLTGRLTRR